MPFYKKKETRFRMTKLDILVFFIILVVFIWAVFIDSFHPTKDQDGNIVYFYDHNCGYNRTIPYINIQFFIGSIILSYEMIILVLLDGKTKGRYLPWNLYYRTVRYLIVRKLQEGLRPR